MIDKDSHYTAELRPVAQLPYTKVCHAQQSWTPQTFGRCNQTPSRTNKMPPEDFVPLKVFFSPPFLILSNCLNLPSNAVEVKKFPGCRCSLCILIPWHVKKCPLGWANMWYCVYQGRSSPQHASHTADWETAIITTLPLTARTNNQCVVMRVCGIWWGDWKGGERKLRVEKQLATISLAAHLVL